MSNSMFVRATKERSKLRVAIDGPAKSGKTYTALVLAQAVTKKFGGRIALIDTERGSASKYADLFDFDVVELNDYHPDQFMKAIKAAVAGDGYSVLVIDSLSHEWMGERGVLQLVDQAQAKQANKFAAWRVPSGLHTKLVDAMLQADIHLVATMRSKMAYEQVQEGNRKVIRKVGLEPVQRSGMEYEFDVLVSIDNEHQATISGSRCPAMDSLSANKPDGGFFAPLLDWVSEGTEPKPKKKAAASKVEEPEPKQQAPADAPHSMTELYRMAEEHGIAKEDAIQIMTASLDGKTIRDAKQEGWTVGDFWKLLVGDGSIIKKLAS